jgi:hypothetical protein
VAHDGGTVTPDTARRVDWICTWPGKSALEGFSSRKCDAINKGDLFFEWLGAGNERWLRESLIPTIFLMEAGSSAGLRKK